MGACVVHNCHSRSERKGDTKMYTFPADAERRKVWAQNAKVDIQKLRRYNRICELHFDDNQWERRRLDGFIKLKPNAVPTLFDVQNMPRRTVRKNAASKVQKDDENTKDFATGCEDVSMTVNTTEFENPKPNLPAMIHCAVCWREHLRAEAVPILYGDGHYSEFGVALSTILKVTNQNVSGKHCCLRCSEMIVLCYDTIVSINVTALISNRRKYQSRLSSEIYKTVSIWHSYAAPRHKPGMLDEKCKDCDVVLDNLDALTAHYQMHLHHRNRLIPGTKDVETQVDELDLDMAVSDFDLTENILETPFQTRKEEVVEFKDGDLINEDCGFSIVTVPVKNELSDTSEIDVDTNAQIEPKIQEWSIEMTSSRAKLKSDPGKDEESVLRVCHICGRNLKTKKDIFNHRNAHLPSRLEKRCCYLCGKSVSRGNLTRHIHRHLLKDSGGTPTKSKNVCDICSTEFAQGVFLRFHMILKHGADPSKCPVRTGKQECWTCNVCKKECPSYLAVRKHAKEEHNGLGTDISCEVCGHRYTALETLAYHIASVHVKNFFSMRCKCGKFFVNKERYMNHCLKTCRRFKAIPKRATCNKTGELQQVKRKRRSVTEKRIEYANNLDPQESSDLQGGYGDRDEAIALLRLSTTNS